MSSLIQQRRLGVEGHQPPSEASLSNFMNRLLSHFVVVVVYAWEQQLGVKLICSGENWAVSMQPTITGPRAAKQTLSDAGTGPCVACLCLRLTEMSQEPNLA